MDIEEALLFLRQHQPLPPDATLTTELAQKYAEIREYFERFPRSTMYTPVSQFLWARVGIPLGRPLRCCLTDVDPQRVASIPMPLAQVAG